MRPTEQMEFVFPSRHAAQAFDDWFWHQCNRPADDLTRNRVTISIITHAERIAAIQRAKALNGLLVHEDIQPH